MAIVPAFFNELNLVDRGPTPAPGGLNNERPDDIITIRHRSGTVQQVTRAQWLANGGGATTDATGQWTVVHAQPATVTAPAQPAVATTPTGAPVLTTQPTPVEQQGSPNAQASQQPGLQGTGPWVRISAAGNILGEHIVRADSPVAQQARVSGIRPTPALVDLTTTPVVPGIPPAQIPNELSLSPNFDAAHRYISQSGPAQIVAYEAVGVQGEDAGQMVQGHKVKWRLPNGVEQTFTFRQSGDQMIVAGAPETDISGYTSPNKALAEKAEAEYKAALAEKARLEAQQIPGQIESQALKNAKERADAAERAFNTSINLGNRTHAEALEDRKTEAGIALTRAQADAVAPNVQVAQQGAQNQTYQNVLQYFRDQGHDEAKAVELTLQYFNNRANVDNQNNTLAVSAARAQVDAQTSANTQRVSLANNRLNASNSGFSDDARSAMDLNQYLKPGSTKGADAFMAMQALRYANARKYGAFDVNDADLRYDPTKLPSGITAFANPSNPSFTPYPTWDEMNQASDGMRGRVVQNRPAPSGFTPMPIQTAPPTTVQRTTTAGVPAQAAGAPRPTVAQPAPAQAGRAASVVQPKPADGNERPDDVLTVVGQQGTAELMTRADYERKRAAGQLPTDVVVKNAESGEGYVRAADGRIVPRVQSSAATAPRAAGGNERPDDVLTIYSQYDGVEKQISRSEWEEQLQHHPHLRDPAVYNVTNAESGLLYDRDPNTGTYVRKPDYGPQPVPVEPTFRGDTSSSVRPMAPAAVADLTAPSQAAAGAHTLLQGPDPEEERRRRQRAFMAQYGTPEGIYGVFEGSFPTVPTYF